MEKIAKDVVTHLFICGRDRHDGKPSCSPKGSEKMIKELKSYVKSLGIKDQVKVSKSSCLGHCESGITACIYPQNRWFHRISPQDLEEIKNMLKSCAK
jgi:(2Fe-2S) ferredoxin